MNKNFNEDELKEWKEWKENTQGKKKGRERNEFMEFVIGAAMLAAGLYMFSSKVSVSTGIFGGMITIGNFSFASGLCVIPFIFGIVMIFMNPDGFGGKLVTGLGLVVIVASVIASTRLYLPRLSLYEWLVYLVLIFGGAGLVLRVLCAKPKDQE